MAAVSLSRRSPRELSAPLTELRRQWAPESLLAEVQELWAQAVGSQIAAAATPIGERDGVVLVGCAEAAWAQELDLLAGPITARLNERLTRGTVRRLRCVIDA